MATVNGESEEAELVEQSFALEYQLRDFLAQNLGTREINGKRLRLYVDPTGREGIEYPTAVGPIDILGIDQHGRCYSQLVSHILRKPEVQMTNTRTQQGLLALGLGLVVGCHEGTSGPNDGLRRASGSPEVTIGTTPTGVGPKVQAAVDSMLTTTAFRDFDSRFQRIMKREPLTLTVSEEPLPGDLIAVIRLNQGTALTRYAVVARMNNRDDG